MTQLFPFEEDLVKRTRSSLPRMTQEERQQNNWKKTNQEKLMSRQQLIQAQNKDTEIQQWLEGERPCYKKKITGVWCRGWIPKGRSAEACDQIIIHKSLRADILKLAHYLPKAGHLGREQMLEQIWKHFWWMTVVSGSCPECQKMAKRGPRAPMVPMPVIGTRF